MKISDADKKADMEAAVDRGENVGLMMPLLLAEESRHRGPLTDLAVDLAAKSAGFRRSLPTGVLAALADLVRAMNFYYSNLIEGHDTHPVACHRARRCRADPPLRRAAARRDKEPIQGSRILPAL